MQDQADELMAKAVELHRSGALKTAVSLYAKVLESRPRDVDVLSNLGCAYRSMHMPEMAVAIHRKALAMCPRHAGVRLNLANALKDLHCYESAIELYLALLADAPDDRQAQLNMAIAYRDCGAHRKSLDTLKELLGAQPDEPSILWEMAQNYLRLGDYRNGWRCFEARWQLGRIALPKLNVPLWRGEPIEGKRLLIVAEQGYGDTLLMARYIPQLIPGCESVVFLCKEELHDLFRGLNVRCVSDLPDDFDAADFMVPLMSLPGRLDPENRQTPGPLPFHVQKSRICKFTKCLAPSASRPNVGIVWSGSVTFQNNHNRSIPLKTLLKLLSPWDVELYSFQKGAPAQDLQQLDPGRTITDAGALCETFADTAAALQSMDVIVMTDSSVAHLAASLGVPVVNLLNHNSYWLYGASGTRTPWYPSMRLVRQRVPGVWDSVVPGLMEVIAELVQACGRTGFPDFAPRPALPRTRADQSTKDHDLWKQAWGTGRTISTRQSFR